MKVLFCVNLWHILVIWDISSNIWWIKKQILGSKFSKNLPKKLKKWENAKKQPNLGMSWLECCEKYKSFKLKIPQPDSERRHSPDFRTVFGIMIGPFSSCEIGKTWGTNKQVNKQTNKNWKFQFPQPDYQPRHSSDFRTVFGIMIGPFSSCEIGKTWGT